MQKGKKGKEKVEKEAEKEISTSNNMELDNTDEYVIEQNSIDSAKIEYDDKYFIRKAEDVEKLYYYESIGKSEHKSSI